MIFFYGCKPDGSRPTPVAWEFYDLEGDPLEMRNEYENPAYAEIIAKMKVELKQTRVKLNETDAKWPAVQKIIDAHW